VMYTRFFTQANASTTGHVTSAFLNGKLAEAIYQAGQVNFTIDFNMFDADLSKRFYASKAITLRPLIGLRGGWINQSVNTAFQGQIDVTEQVKNNFTGFGPKTGIESTWDFYNANDYQLSILSNFTTSYLWGSWDISDVLYGSNSITFDTNVGKRDLGAFTIQGMMGINLDYKHFSVKFGYEIADWFNQYQVLDDASGGHNNDLVLQGITLGLTYRS